MKKQQTQNEDRKDTIIHWRADDGLVRMLDEGKERFGTRSEFIRQAVSSFKARRDGR